MISLARMLLGAGSAPKATSHAHSTPAGIAGGAAAEKAGSFDALLEQAHAAGPTPAAKGGGATAGPVVPTAAPVATGPAGTLAPAEPGASPSHGSRPGSKPRGAAPASAAGPAPSAGSAPTPVAGTASTAAARTVDAVAPSKVVASGKEPHTGRATVAARSTTPRPEKVVADHGEVTEGAPSSTATITAPPVASTPLPSAPIVAPSQRASSAPERPAARSATADRPGPRSATAVRPGSTPPAPRSTNVDHGSARAGTAVDEPALPAGRTASARGPLDPTRSAAPSRPQRVSPGTASVPAPAPASPGASSSAAPLAPAVHPANHPTAIAASNAVAATARAAEGRRARAPQGGATPPEGEPAGRSSQPTPVLTGGTQAARDPEPARARAPALHPAAAAAPEAAEPGLSGAVLARGAHLHLTTDTLGDVSLHLRLKDGAAHVRVEADARAAVEARAPELARALAAEGIGLARLEVEPRTHPGATASGGDGGGRTSTGSGGQPGQHRAAEDATPGQQASQAPARRSSTHRGTHDVTA